MTPFSYIKRKSVCIQHTPLELNQLQLNEICMLLAYRISLIILRWLCNWQEAKIQLLNTSLMLSLSLTHTHPVKHSDKHSCSCPQTYPQHTTPHPFFPNPLLQSDLCPSWPRQWLWRCLCCQRSGWAPDQSERWSAEIQDRPAGTEPAPHGTKLHTHNGNILHVNHCSSLYISTHVHTKLFQPTSTLLHCYYY